MRVHVLDFIENSLMQAGIRDAIEQQHTITDESTHLFVIESDR